MGKYRIKAVVTHAQLPHSYETEQVEFNIIDGKVVWSTSVGVPSLSLEEDNDSKIDKKDFLNHFLFRWNKVKYSAFWWKMTSIFMGLTKVGI